MEFPKQESTRAYERGRLATPGGSSSAAWGFDMRDHLAPRRMTAVMWDFAAILRHMPGDSFEDYDRVLDEACARGYNTVRLDPMPHAIDLRNPDRILTRRPEEESDDPRPLNPWHRPQAFEGPAGRWLIELVEKLRARGLFYGLSAWCGDMEPALEITNLHMLTERWQEMLTQWKERFGFDGLLWVDLSNEYPYFIPGHLRRTVDDFGGRWSDEWNAYIREEVNGCLAQMRRAFPELRFTLSLHGDPRWIDLGLELDLMDIHFYADADPRWAQRTLFDRNARNLFKDASLYEDFSRRSGAAHRAMAPMFRARQRAKVASFVAWAETEGIPLFTTESWASWYYIDHPDLDWRWLLEWAEWSVEDAIDFRMWGWTPHNYVQPQFANWQDPEWHRRLTRRFLTS